MEIDVDIDNNTHYKVVRYSNFTKIAISNGDEKVTFYGTTDQIRKLFEIVLAANNNAEIGVKNEGNLV